MTDLPIAIKKSIRNNKPVEMDGLILYPILVEEMDEFNEARPAIEFMQQSLPVQFAVMPLLAAFYALDYEKRIQTGTTTGLFYRAVLFLCLALRLGQGKSVDERTGLVSLKIAPDNPAKLLAIKMTINGEEQINITPSKFSRLRPVLAAQNGLFLPDETANKELLEAKTEIQSTNAPDLVYDFDTQLTAVAHAEQRDEAEIMKWPVRKFNARFKAVDRSLRFVICSLAEANGARWKDGNPVPSWCFDSAEKNPALISASDFLGGKAQKAIQQQSV